MFIEQIRGWSQIQATTPRNYSIQNIENVSIEYLLSLDVQKIKKEKEEIDAELSLLKQKWMLIKNEMQELASRIGSVLNNFPNQITTNLEEKDFPKLSLIIGDKLIDIDSYLSDLREQHEKLVKDNTDETSENSPDLQAKLDEYENKLISLNTQLREINSEYNLEKDSLKYSTDRYESIENDIKKHLDIKRIINLGATDELSIVKGSCPTCKQAINDVLIENFSEPMSIDENINFLHSQKDALKYIINTNSKKLDALLTKKMALQNEIRKLREIIISIKSDMVSTQNISEHKIRERIYMEQRIQHIEKERDLFEEKIESLLNIISSISENRKRKAGLTSDHFSKNDRSKLDEFTKIFSELLNKYGYRSTRVGRIIISEDNYRPICSEEGFEISLDSSASDNIRIIWAYTVSLLILAQKYSTNHWGIIILDEPEQQRMKEASSAELYNSFSFNTPSSYQSIIATSESGNNLLAKVKNIECNFMDFGEKVITPEKDWKYKG